VLPLPCLTRLTLHRAMLLCPQAASAFAQETVRLSTASAALFETVGASWEEVTAPETEWKLVQVITP
jgi:hypothetical protein